MSNGTPQPLTPTQFRAMFPAFGDATTYPDPTIQIWLDLAPVDPAIWQDWYQLGQGLWTAHELAKTASPDALAAGAAGLSGPVQSKSVGPVSVSFNTTIGLEEADGAGQYNTTLYGRQFYHYMKLVGGGPWQIGPSDANFDPGLGAWVGPPPLPGWFA